MSVCELVVLGTASRIPTRHRNHNGYLLRWDGRNILFDPGEGTQRQFTLAGVSPASITDICITHFHGDHSLGLAGIIQRLSNERVTRPVDVVYPASGQEYFDRLRRASIFDDRTNLVPRPLSEDVHQWESGSLRFEARPLEHRIPTLGYRVSEPDGRRFLPEELEARGVRGPDVGLLSERGTLDVRGRTVRLEEVTEPKPGRAFAFIMDTRPCPGAAELARGATMAVIESTFLECDAELADEYGHTTAAGAARLARDAGVDLLVLSHFSQRYIDTGDFLREAAPIHPNAHLAQDFDRIPLRPSASLSQRSARDAGPSAI